MSSDAHRAAAYLAQFVVTGDARTAEYAKEILDTPEYASVDVSHLGQRRASATPVREIPAELAALVGEDVVRRVKEAASRIRPLTPEAAEAFASGPEISGGVDVEPDEEENETETYTIHLDVNLHGWEEGVDVEVEAENQWHACKILGEALTKLCAKRSKRTR
jgi:hypothetical protein